VYGTRGEETTAGKRGLIKFATRRGDGRPNRILDDISGEGWGGNLSENEPLSDFLGRSSQSSPTLGKTVILWGIVTDSPMGEKRKFIR